MFLRVFVTKEQMDPQMIDIDHSHLARTRETMPAAGAARSTLQTPGVDER